jgi:hypothetical protein
VVDDGAAAAAVADVPAPAPAAGAEPDQSFMDEVDVDFDDPGEPADESAARARLLEAFPGAEEVSG